ncbi:MAG TPA: ABC transporter permease, partial [Anaerolineae bacterium]|nr:ABC transporter permease [Anaerolineae bacterium]
MTKYIIRRLLWSVPVLLLVALFTFSLVRAIPGGPFDFAGDKSLPPTTRANLMAKYHLDDPPWLQFCSWLVGDQVCTLGKRSEAKGILQGDLGPSFRYRSRSVNDIIASGLPISAQLGLLAILLGLIIGIPAGIVA